MCLGAVSSITNLLCTMLLRLGFVICCERGLITGWEDFDDFGGDYYKYFMDIDYQKKYISLQNLCKKQEQTITKLQAEIRERCQSYLLHASRHKKING